MNSSQNNTNSLLLVRLTGYGLLAISLVHIVDIFIPLQFMNPTWEFGITALLLERTPLPLVGLAMAFWGGAELRGKWEVLLLKVLSWSALIVGLLFLLLVPMGVSAALRLNEQATAQISTQYEQQILQLEQAQSSLEGANSEELASLAEVLRNQNSTMDVSNPQALRIRLSEEITQVRQNTIENRRNSQQRQRLELQKNMLKWGLISLVSAYLFIYIWHLTRWTRRLKL